MKQIKPDTTPAIYCDAKQLAADYQIAKMEVCIFFPQNYHYSLPCRSIKPFKNLDSVYGLYVLHETGYCEILSLSFLI